MLYDVLGAHNYYIIHRCTCRDVEHQRKMKVQVTYINSAKQDQGQYIPLESIISTLTKKAKDSAAQDKPVFIHRE